MLKKYKIALATTLALVGGAAGIAAAHGHGSPEERKEMHEKKKAEMLARFDTNKDGKLDATERAAAHEARAAEQFARLDKNGDGKLSLEEFKAGHQERHGRRGGFRGRP